jgi:hypothetical protein
LHYELEIVRLLKRTAALASLPAETWHEISNKQLERAVLQRGPVVALVELHADLREWFESGDPRRVQPGPITLLAYVPSLRDSHRVKQISDGAKLVLESFDGSRSTAEISEQLAADYDVEQTSIVALARTWLADRVLTMKEVPPT